MPVLISPKNVEQKYGITVDELARWRRTSIGPEYYRIAPRVIRYGTDDLYDWFTDPQNARLHDLPVTQMRELCQA
jgi:hypothetical protein